MPPGSLRVGVDADGFTVLRGVLTPEEADEVALRLDAESGGARGNRRSLLRDSRLVREMAEGSPLRGIAEELIGAGAFPVRALLFDKTPEANWAVPWHQDLAVPVSAARRDVPGFSGWSEKDGIPHAIAPAWVLEGMVTLRLHLDDCPHENAPLRVLRGSHCEGVLDEPAVEEWKLRGEVVECVVARGDVVVMKPLVLHSSARAESPQRRRVLHVEYAVGGLPQGVEWAGCGR